MAHSAAVWKAEVLRLEDLIETAQDQWKTAHAVHWKRCNDEPKTVENLNESYAIIVRCEDRLTTLRRQRAEAFMWWADATWKNS